MFDILNTGILKLNLRIICSMTDPENLWEWDRGKFMVALSLVYISYTIVSLYDMIITVETVSLIVLSCMIKVYFFYLTFGH